MMTNKTNKEEASRMVKDEGQNQITVLEQVRNTDDWKDTESFLDEGLILNERRACAAQEKQIPSALSLSGFSSSLVARPSDGPAWSAETMEESFLL